jgi:hypothetical protein
MAARKDSRIKTKHREAIKTSMIMKRLTDHIDGKVELSSTQVRAAQILLNKTLPDMRAIEMTGEGGGPLEHKVRAFKFVDPEPSD